MLGDQPGGTPVARPNQLELAEALQSAHNCIVYDSRDWALTSRDAWLFGLFVGWVEPDETEDGVFDELMAKHRWSQEDVDRLQRLRAAIRAAS